MKSACLTASQKIEIREIPEPSTPVDGVKLRVHACGICGSDLRRWKEGPPLGITGFTPGHEAAGTLVEVGSKVTRFREGDRIAIAPDVHCGICYYCRRGMFNLCDTLRFIGITPEYPGAFAEYLILTDEILRNGIVHRMPEGMDFQHAALAEPLCSVLAAHQKMGDTLGYTIAILGAGPIGCLHAIIGKAKGARVFVSECSFDRRRLVERFHPDKIFDPSQEDVIQKVREDTQQLGADAVICANPVAETQTQAVQMVRKGGRVILFGGLPKSNPMTTLDSNRIHYGEIEVVGAFSYHPSVHETALHSLHRGVIPTEQIITDRYPLDSIQEGFEKSSQGFGLKTMITL